MIPSNKTLEFIKENGVFGIEEHEGKLYLVEKCDEYFAVVLTKEICEDLAEVFKSLAQKL